MTTRIALAIGSVVLALALLEAAFRFFFEREIAPTTRTGFVVADPDLIWKLRPRETGPLATNQLGLRDTYYNENADVRILVLGDSVSWGDDVDTWETWPYVLERLLDERAPGTTFEVINAGVPGYSTFQHAKYLELYGLALDPHAIVLQFCLNDVVERYSALAEYGGENVFLGIDTRNAVSGVQGFLLRSSRFYEALARALVGFARDQQEYEVKNLSADSLGPELEAAWSRTLSEIDGIRDVADEHGLPLLLVIAPYEYQLRDPRGTGQPQARLVAYSRTNALRVRDLLPAFAAELAGAGHSALFIDANHFSPSGHRLAAEALVADVEGLLHADAPE